MNAGSAAFQFPSNGKAQRKTAPALQPGSTKTIVSIPFKRESTAKVCVLSARTIISYQCFNSLQTGKHSESQQKIMKGIGNPMFQFPSNGKAQRKQSDLNGGRPNPNILVSIPFKRESTAKDKLINPCTGRHVYVVSIPFKRESTAKVNNGSSNGQSQSLFQFPSNGKAQRKHRGIPYTPTWVVEFQFPSNGKAQRKPFRYTYLSIPIPLFMFQFPSNGKAQRKLNGNFRMWMRNQIRFNSLQTGKHSESGRRTQNKASQNHHVSIPFKRESTAKE